MRDELKRIHGEVSASYDRLAEVTEGYVRGEYEGRDLRLAEAEVYRALSRLHGERARGDGTGD